MQKQISTSIGLLYAWEKSLEALLLLFTPTERGQSRCYESSRDHKHILALQKHHGLGSFVRGIQKQCALVPEDARSTASIMEDILLLKFMTS